MLGQLPPISAAFFLCFGGALLGTALLLWGLWTAVCGGVRRRGGLRRLAVLGRDDGASTIVEFPFVLLILVLIIVLTCQLAFMSAAYLVVDYAAFAAVRCAVVVIPQKNSNEDVNKIGSLDSDSPGNSSKIKDIQRAAAFVCYPIAGTYGSNSSWQTNVPVINQVLAVPGADAFRDFLDDMGFATRFLYAQLNTSVTLRDSASSNKKYAGGELITVRVVHRFSLRIPIADRIFGTHRPIEGYVTEMVAQGSMLNEGYSEVAPAGAPAQGGGGPTP